MTSDVVKNESDTRYEIWVEGRLAGFANYRLRPGRVVIPHTEIDPEFEGKGLGSRLARAALDDIRRSELKVTPLCPFIADYIRRNPEYQDLVA
ncbi:GNAT family N-acetyltransferase [Rhizohabitans arisaemae]|uniref:GNAT family N-acetyltransferase n=1 Tax=Rhizohabitans arisaemae TaxID=2720610 RepID=UPI0024B19DAE|nr:GNAT family N-acetyltransferase [Rhizohabitans arisaemae]